MVPPPPWLLVADDLTGACDAAAAFAVHGFSAEVVWGRNPLMVSRAELLAVSTETREATAGEAAEAVSRVCLRAGELGRRLVYKKIDSVLRGAVGAELAAAREAAGYARVTLCPALPEQGRTVRSGRVFVGEAPLDSDLPRAPWLDAADASTRSDLMRIAGSLVEADSLLAGSAGLACAWAAVLGRWFDRPFANPPLPAVPAPIAVVVGSHHPATLAQVDYWRGASGAATLDIRDAEAALMDSLFVLEMRGADASTFAPLGRAFQRGAFAALVATGGATSRVILESFGANRLNIKGEIDRGVPWSIVRGGAADGIPLVTKSGGFGAPDFLTSLVRRWPRTQE